MATVVGVVQEDMVDLSTIQTGICIHTLLRMLCCFLSRIWCQVSCNFKLQEFLSTLCIYPVSYQYVFCLYCFFFPFSFFHFAISVKAFISETFVKYKENYLINMICRCCYRHDMCYTDLARSELCGWPYNLMIYIRSYDTTDCSECGTQKTLTSSHCNNDNNNDDDNFIETIHIHPGRIVKAGIIHSFQI